MTAKSHNLLLRVVLMSSNAFRSLNRKELPMYMVYWTTMENREARPNEQAFDSSELTDALGFMEALRARQRAGEGIGFVTMCSENPDSVGHPGAADPAPDYHWKKRRR